jgi:hypothetical protein
MMTAVARHIYDYAPAWTGRATGRKDPSLQVPAQVGPGLRFLVISLPQTGVGLRITCLLAGSR